MPDSQDRERHDDAAHVTWGQFRRFREEMEERMSAQQGDIDAVTAALGQVETDLTAAQTNIQSELDALEAQVAAGQPANLDALKAAVAQLDPAVQAISALKPDQPPAPGPQGP